MAQRLAGRDSRTPVTCITAPNPGPMTLRGTNTYVIGSDFGYVIDPGPNIESHVQALVNYVTAIRLSTRAILLTHGHPDHCGAAAVLSSVLRAPILASEIALRCVPEAGAVTRVLHPSESLPLPADQLLVVGSPGHTSGDISFLTQEERALFCGDVVLGEGTTVIAPPEGDMQSYFDTLRRFLELQPSIMYPGHGSPVSDPPGRIQEYISHRMEREEQIKDALSYGPSTAAQIVERAYVDLDPELKALAELSVRAHLVRLERMNLVTSRGDRFSLQ